MAAEADPLNGRRGAGFRRGRCIHDDMCIGGYFVDRLEFPALRREEFPSAVGRFGVV
jgi:hypothetical protein